MTISIIYIMGAALTGIFLYLKQRQKPGFAVNPIDTIALVVASLLWPLVWLVALIVVSNDRL